MATSNPSADQLYPLSTRDGESIPLEVMGPQGLLVKSFTALGTTGLVIPTSFVIGSLYSSAGCILQMGAATIPNPLLDNTEYPNTVFVPPETLITVALIAGAARVIPLVNAGSLYIQNVRK